MEIKVLVSDDQKLWREDILADSLRDSGYIVKTAETIEQTFELLKKEFFHIVTVDLSFSDDHEIVEGLGTVKLISELNEGTKAIVLTGYGTARNATEALRSFNAFHFLEKGKSFDEQEFLDVVAEAARSGNMNLIQMPLTISIQNVTSGISIHDLSSRIGEKEDEVIWLIRNLMNKVHPAIYHKCDGSFLKNNPKIFRKKLWSRMHGKAIDLLIGGKTDIDNFIVKSSDILLDTSYTEHAKGCLVEDEITDFMEFS